MKRTSMDRMLQYGAIVIGILFVVLAYVYATTQAQNLPHYIPGHIDNSTVIHVKHSIAAAILALASFVFAWFKSGTKT